jgi:hypothetical protein
VLSGFEAKRALTECQKSRPDAGGSERRGADAGSDRTSLTKAANPSLSAIFYTSNNQKQKAPVNPGAFCFSANIAVNLFLPVISPRCDRHRGNDLSGQRRPIPLE